MSEPLKPKHRPKTRVGKQFVLVRLLACGPLGETWVANDELRRRPVVLRFLPFGLSTPPRFRARIQQRFSLVKPLEHHSIRPVEQMIGDEKDGFFLVSPFFKGKNLAELLRVFAKKSIPFRDEQILKILWQTASAIDYAHKFHILHLGLKPNNILIGQNEQVCVTDFLIPSEIRETLQMSGQKTVLSFDDDRFIAPEQLLGQRLTVKTDQFALALLAYRLFYQQFPWSADNLLDWGNLLLHEPIPSEPLANTSFTTVRKNGGRDSEKLHETFMKGLAIPTFRRYHSCRQFVYQLKSCFSGLSEQLSEIVLPEDDIPDDAAYVSEILRHKKQNRDTERRQLAKEIDRMEKRSFFSLFSFIQAVNFALILFVLLMLYQRREQIRSFFFPNPQNREQPAVFSEKTASHQRSALNSPEELSKPSESSDVVNPQITPITPVTIPKPATGLPITSYSSGE
ncbi:MAG: serine/threonine protein kinase [Planctomycetaceae bacterium]|nr:serine/threonine protein kinase [Planctomycetaceae bacterium]